MACGKTIRMRASQCKVVSRTWSRNYERSVAPMHVWTQGDARRPPVSEQLPPGPRRARPASHAPLHAFRATHRLHWHHTLCSLPTLGFGQREHRALTHGANIDVFCANCRGTRGAAGMLGTHREARGSGPARCVTHLSRRFLACSRSPPSAERRSLTRARTMLPDVATKLMPSIHFNSFPEDLFNHNLSL